MSLLDLYISISSALPQIVSLLAPLNQDGDGLEAWIDSPLPSNFKKDCIQTPQSSSEVWITDSSPV